jgi:hypothetical protein
MQKVYLACVAYGAVEPLWVQSLLRLVHDARVKIEVVWNVGDSLVSRSRNTVTAHFLTTDCTDLVFIDTDIGFSRLCQHDEDIVAGFYPKKQDGPVQWVCNALPGSPITESGLQEQLYMGTGFMRIRRRVFDQLIGRYPELEYVADGSGKREWDFWKVGVYQYADKTRRYLSEDWMFCQFARDLGFKIYGDTHIMLQHVGKLTYPTAMQLEAIKIANEAYDRNKNLDPVGQDGPPQGIVSPSVPSADREISPPVVMEARS